MPKIGRNDPCPCGSGRKHKKCCLDRDRQATDEGDILAAYETATPGEMILRLQTDQGMLVRHVPSASPLRSDLDPGPAAEDATHDAAAMWGLPDFVFRPAIAKSQSWSREVGDGTLLVGRVGVVIQVKSRNREAVGDPAKEVRWLDKQIKQALSQANGTIRTLKRQKMSMVNVRSREVEVDGNDYWWLEVVVIDHPDIPRRFVPDGTNAKNPAVVLSRRDWEWLFNQLKSTRGVVDYLERVSSEMVDLDSEAMRYTELAVADIKAPPDPPDFDFAEGGGMHINAPLLPLQPVATEDRGAHLVVRTIFEDIAVFPLPSRVDEMTRIRVLAELDRLPLAHRGQIGNLLLQWLDEVAKTPADETLWQFRRVVPSRRAGGPTVQLGFGTCSKFSKMHHDCFAAWVQLRHHAVYTQLPSGEGDELATVGVLLTNRSDGVRPWDTTMIAVAGDPELTDDDLAAFRALWSPASKAA